MEKFQVRKAITSDAEELSALIRETALEILRPQYSEEQWSIFSRYYSTPVMLEKIRTQVFFCGINNKTIVGCIGLHDGCVVGFYTRLNFRSQGVGTMLMAHLEAYSRELGLNELKLAASPAAVDFYSKNGWQKVKDFVVEHCGVEFHETLMKKKIKL